MLAFANWGIPLLFWFFTFQLARRSGIGKAAPFALLWTAGFLGFRFIGIEGPIYFISFESVLTVIVVMANNYLETKSGNNTNPNPLKEFDERN